MNDVTSTFAPTVDGAVAVMRDLLALWRNPGETRNIAILDRSATRGVSTLAHADHAASLAEATIVLIEHGMVIQAVPLARLTLECGVTAAWWSVTPNSGAAANREAARQRRNMIADLAGLVGKSPEAESAEAAAMMKELADFDSVEARNFIDRAGALVGTEWVYPYYRLMSAYSHAGALLVDHYTPNDPDSELGWAYRDGGEFDHARATFAIQAIALWLAMRAADDLDPRHPRRARLDEIAASAHMNMTVERRPAKVKPTS